MADLSVSALMASIIAHRQEGPITRIYISRPMFEVIAGLFGQAGITAAAAFASDDCIGRNVFGVSEWFLDDTLDGDDVRFEGLNG